MKMEMWQKQTAETKLNSMLFSDIAVNTGRHWHCGEERAMCLQSAGAAPIPSQPGTVPPVLTPNLIAAINAQAARLEVEQG